MAAIGGIHIITDRKAKILTAIKASLRAYESTVSPEAAKAAGKQIEGESFEAVYLSCAQELSQDIAIVLSDEYVSVCYEDIDTDELEKNALGYCAVFEKPVIVTQILDDDVMVIAVYDGGKRRTRLVFGEYAEDYGLTEKAINMDELSRLFRSHHPEDLNDCHDISELCYAMSEDYGIDPNLSPLSLPLYSDEWKLLEKSESFSVYSSL